ARVTIPRRGSCAEGRRFANKNIGWLEKQLLRQANRPATSREWIPGTEILFRGEKVRLELSASPQSCEVRFAERVIPIHQLATCTPLLATNLRPAVEKHLWALAVKELPVRVAELARERQFVVRQVSVRNQRSRWGSCSRQGTISLNWRLIQTPP